MCASNDFPFISQFRGNNLSSGQQWPQNLIHPARPRQAPTCFLAHPLPLWVSNIFSLLTSIRRHSGLKRAPPRPPPPAPPRDFLGNSLHDLVTALQAPSFHLLRGAATGQRRGCWARGQVHGDLQEVWVLETSAGRRPPALGMCVEGPSACSRALKCCRDQTRAHSPERGKRWWREQRPS